MPDYTPAQTAKSWVALIGSAINVTVFGLQQSLQFLPPHWALTANAALGVLTAVAVYFVPNAPATVPDQAAASGPPSPWPAAEPLTAGQLPAREGSSGPVGP